MTTTETSVSSINNENMCSSEDCWMGVTDPKKRKQIQDRLAQRARRKRLAEAKKQTIPPASQLIRRKEQVKPGENGVTSTSNSDSLHLMPIPLNVYSALYKNGNNYLGLVCSNSIPGLSSPAGHDVPEPLRPTSVQIMTIHPLWIDRFPFPKMRENFIMLLGVIDPEEFLNDMFNGPSFTLAAGGASWDPSVWSIEEGFREKWGFLFDEGLFELEAAQ